MNDAEFQRLLNSTETVILPAHRGKLFIGAFTQCAMSLIGARLLQAVGNLVALLQGVLRGPSVEAYSLTLSSQGLKLLDPRSLSFGYRWDEMSKFVLGKNGVFYFDTTTEMPLGNYNKRLFGYNKMVRNIYDINTKQLVKLLNHWRERAIANKTG